MLNPLLLVEKKEDALFFFFFFIIIISFETLKLFYYMGQHQQQGAAAAQQMETYLLNIPSDIIVIILLRLPMKSLLRLKSVCKYLYSFISSPSFVKFHLDHAINTRLNQQNNHNPLLVILDWKRTSSSSRKRQNADSLTAKANVDNHSHVSVPYSLNFSCESCGGGCDHHDELLRPQVVNKMNWPFESPLQFQFWGSCNGLLCIRGISTTDKRQNSLPFIWNPSTQEFKTLPRTSMEYNPRGIKVYLYYDYYGFGYDRNIDDYKVIRGANRIDGHSKRLDYTTIIKIYTLGTNSWRRIQLDNPFDFHYEVREKKGMLVNGALHWLMSRSSGISSARIISFDIADEEFREVERPYFIQSFLFVDLQVLRGCLCVLHMRMAEGKKSLDVWLMNDYGVMDSWTKLVTISVPVGSMHPLSLNRSLKLLKFCRNGEVLMLRNDRDLLVCDFRKGTARWVRRDTGLDIEGFLSTETYIESLVSLKPATYMDQEQAHACQEQAQLKMKHRKRKNLKKRKRM